MRHCEHSAAISWHFTSSLRLPRSLWLPRNDGVHIGFFNFVFFVTFVVKIFA